MRRGTPSLNAAKRAICDVTRRSTHDGEGSYTCTDIQRSAEYHFCSRRCGRGVAPGYPSSAVRENKSGIVPNVAESTTRIAIRAISEGPCATLLKGLGFRRKAPHFWRGTEGIFQSVNFQASQWGTHEAGSFTINVGVSSPALYQAFTGRELPKSPASLLWPVNRRIGSLMPSRRDHWWKVDSRTDVIRLGADVAADLEAYAVPFLEKLRTPARFNSVVLAEDCVTGLSEGQALLVRATLSVQLDNEPAARKYLKDALGQYKGRPFEQTVRATAVALNLDLHDA
jgi:hypothetical protein